MFDAHAHKGDECSATALVCSSSEREYEALLDCPFRALGTIPEGGLNPDMAVLEKAASTGFHIGEIGLDRRYDGIPRQEEIFRTALEIARRYDRLAVIHSVRMNQRVLEIIREMGIHRFLMHGYTGSAEQASAFIREGGIISLSPRAERTRHFKALITLPFVTETDMRTGKEEEAALLAWNERLSALTGINIAERTERMMKEALG